MIYQTHPKHGKHIAYNLLEEQQNISNGWETVTEKEFYGNSVDLTDRQMLVIAYEKRFGKKPHHMMKEETIQAKLDE